MNYLNEWSAFHAEWCRNLAAAGEIPKCFVDETDIRQVKGDQLSEYNQCHFFAGIAGWPLALKLAGVPDDFRVWTGSCPCQPFSVIGKRKGESDERHLWPEFRRLYRIGRPPFMFGEQVAGKDGIGWLDSVQADLQSDGYAVVSAELCGPLVEKDHQRARIYWGAWDTANFRPVQFAGDCDADGNCPVCGIDYAECECPGPTEDGVVYADTGSGLYGLRMADAYLPRQSADRGAILQDQRHDARGGGLLGCRLVYSSGSRLQGHSGDGHGSGEPGWIAAGAGRSTATASGNVSFVECENSKWRRFQSGSFPMAHGIPRVVGRNKSELGRVASDARANRNGRIEGYGNAIMPELAALFITEFFGSIKDLAGAR